MEKELERTKAENVVLREARVTPKEDEDEAESEKPETEDPTKAPTVPESFFITPQKPVGFDHQSWRWTANAD